MHAYIICGGTIETRRESMLTKSSGLVELIHLVAEKTTITIKQVHTLLSELTLHPRLPRLVWVEEAGLMTLPAQNSLLKSLEEPPEDTVFYLTLSRPDALLPTVRSRAQLIRLGRNTSVKTATHLPLIKEAMRSTPGNRLLLQKNLPTDRGDARAWLAELLTEISVVMQTTSAYSSLQILLKLADNASRTEERLSQNCNVSLTLQNFLLHLPTIKL